MRIKKRTLYILLVIIAVMVVWMIPRPPDYDALSNLDAAPGPIICLGDSLTRGFGAPGGSDYPSLLAQRLGRDVINAGRDGDTTGDALNRLDRDVLSKQPQVVIVFLGGNDVLNRRNRRETMSNLDTIVRRCVEAGAATVIVHARLGLFSDPYRKEMDALAKRHGALIIHRVLKGILGQPRYMYDQIHPNADGYALLEERIAKGLSPLLERLQQ